jgi:hypothetical protein
LVGFAQPLAQAGVDVILEGTLFNDYFRGYCAREWVAEKQWMGLRPTRYRKTDWQYSEQISPFWRDHLAKELSSRMTERRRHTYEAFAQPERGSVAEWMEIYPFTQDPTVGYYPAERRTLPVRLVVMDRRALDFSFRCPIELKLGSRLYLKAVNRIYGRGASIPNNSDGVRPDSGHWSRLGQRGVHELKRAGTKFWNGTSQVQHSWLDYPKYWRESAKLRAMCLDYGPKLDEFDGVLFNGRGRDLLASKGIYCEFGFRLLQLAVWRDVVHQYEN